MMQFILPPQDGDRLTRGEILVALPDIAPTLKRWNEINFTCEFGTPDSPDSEGRLKRITLTITGKDKKSKSRGGS